MFHAGHVLVIVSTDCVAFSFIGCYITLVIAVVFTGFIAVLFFITLGLVAVFFLLITYTAFTAYTALLVVFVDYKFVILIGVFEAAFVPGLSLLDIIIVTNNDDLVFTIFLVGERGALFIIM